MGSFLIAAHIVRHAKLVLWDFDGVIKESVDVKTRAFAEVFEPFGPHVVDYVRRHHEANGGMSRFQKIPLYLAYAGQSPTADRVRELCEQFGQRVRQGVIDASWVPGAESWLRRNPQRQVFAVASATPQDELDVILEALSLRDCLHEAFGAPTSKRHAIQMTLSRRHVAPHESVMIGDSRADLEAARVNGVPFVLRRHASNADVFAEYDGPWITDLTGI